MGGSTTLPPPNRQNGSPAAEHSPPGTSRTSGGRKVQFPDEPDADGNPCLRGMDACDEALGGPGAAANWQQVGAGRGSYEVVETLVYVGEGKGNFNKEEVEPVKQAPVLKITWQRKLYMGILCSLLFAGAISLTVSLILGPKPQALRPPPYKEVFTPPSGRPPSEEVKKTSVCHKEVQSWSMKERQFCCSQFGVGCPDLKCLSGRDDWQHAWSPGKKIWCCQHHHVGCDPRDAPKEVQVVEVPVPVPAPPKPPASPTPAPSAKVTEHHGFWRPMEPKATAKASATKAHAETVPLVAAGPGRPAGAPALANALRNNDATPEPFQCTGESKGWTEKRQEWCCWHYGTGCPR